MPADTRVLHGADDVAAAQPRRMLSIDNRYLPPLLITSILLGAHLSFGILEGWEGTGLAIATAMPATSGSDRFAPHASSSTTLR